MAKATRTESRGGGLRRMGRWVGFTLTALGAGWAFVAGCGVLTASPRTGSETHFLTACVADCDQGFACLAGVCTLPCGGDAECWALDAAAVCIASGTSEPDSCQVECVSDRDCRERNDAWSCNAGLCSAPAAIQSARIQSTSESARCQTLSETRPAPVEIETTFAPVPGAGDLLLAVADEAGLYWMEADGSVHSLAHGSSASITLRARPDYRVVVKGMLSDRARLYWAEAPEYGIDYQPGDLPLRFGRLFAAPKLGGSAELVIEVPQSLHLLAITSSGVVVTNSSSELYLIDAGELRAVANFPPLVVPQIVDDNAYWLGAMSGPDGPELFAAAFPDGEHRRLGRLAGGSGLDFFVAGFGSATGGAEVIEWEYLVGSGVALWSAQEALADRQVDHLMQLELQSGCVRELPSGGEMIGDELIDGRYVYWMSVDSNVTDVEASVPLLRVNLETDTLERLVAPGLELSLSTRLVAQDAGYLYVNQRDSGMLVALRKPD